MTRKVVVLVLGILSLATLLDCGDNVFCSMVHARSCLFVVLYTSVLVLARYSPGACHYRMAVLSEPGRHLSLEVAKARQFATYVGTRLLFAGLIFTLLDVAAVLLKAEDVVAAAGTLSMALSASLYALVFYAMVHRAGTSAGALAGMDS